MGRMQYLFDENGRRYPDAFGGIATVCCGHCHPDVVDAILTQTKHLQHSTILYLNPAIAEFAEALASKLPGDLKVVFFTNSGTDANELALMIARLYTGCHDIISLRNSYHGNATGTMGATAQCNWKFNVIQAADIEMKPYTAMIGPLDLVLSRKSPWSLVMPMANETQKNIGNHQAELAVAEPEAEVVSAVGFETETETVAEVVAEPREQHNCCEVHALDSHCNPGESMYPEN
ncbi:hypothetical protein Ancab_031911 [Ancistrocladus abbreviatus]